MFNQILLENFREGERFFNPLVSVVIPVYNVEDYLAQCLVISRNKKNKGMPSYPRNWIRYGIYLICFMVYLYRSKKVKNE